MCVCVGGGGGGGGGVVHTHPSLDKEGAHFLASHYSGWSVGIVCHVFTLQ